jgi:hypothetical protein
MSNAKIKVLAYYQIAGGLLGIGITIWLIATTEVVTGVLLLILMLAFSLYGFSCYCGRELLRGKIERGLTLSTINQYLQLISFSLPGYAYSFTSGFKVAIGLDFTKEVNLGLNASLSEFRFNINSDTELITVGINLFAIFVIVLIGRMENAMALETANAELLPSATASDSA